MSKWDTAPRAPLVREAASLYAGEFIVTARAVGNLRVPNALHRFQFLANKKDHTGILMPMRPSFLASLLSLAPCLMPPTRGHDLKQLVRGPMRVPGGYAPTPGNVLKYFAPHLANTPGDAPTVSLLSVLLSSLFSLTLFYSKQFLALKPMLLLMQIILLIFSL